MAVIAPLLRLLLAHTGVAPEMVHPAPDSRSIGGRGRVKHAEFAFASGEMTPPEYVEFLEGALGNAARVSRDDAVHYVCSDWRHVTCLTPRRSSTMLDM
jgi:hypothetical protein